MGQVAVEAEAEAEGLGELPGGVGHGVAPWIGRRGVATGDMVEVPFQGGEVAENFAGEGHFLPRPAVIQSRAWRREAPSTA